MQNTRLNLAEIRRETLSRLDIIERNLDELEALLEDRSRIYVNLINRTRKNVSVITGTVFFGQDNVKLVN